MRVEHLESKLGDEHGRGISQRELEQVEYDFKNKVRELSSQIENVQTYALDNKQTVKMDMAQFQQQVEERLRAIEARAASGPAASQGFISSKQMTGPGQ